MRRWVTALLTAACLLLSGCITPRSLDNYGYVIAVAFDRGEQLDYTVTFMVQKPEPSTDSGSKKGFVLLSAEAANLFEAIEAVATQSPLELSFARTAFLVFSLPLLQTRPDALKGLTDISFPKLKIRYNVHLLVSLTDAGETLAGLENDFDMSPSKLQSNFASYADAAGWIPTANLSLFSEAVNGNAFDLMVPLMGVSEGENVRAVGDSVGENRLTYIGGRLPVDAKMKTGLAGAAILKDDRVVGLLDGRHVQRVLMATGAFRSGRMQIRMPDGEHISVMLRRMKKPKRKLTLGSSPSARTEIYLFADVELPQSGTGYAAAELEKLIANEIEAAYPPLFTVCRSLGADVFGFGKLAKTKFQTVREWEAYDWERAYGAMDAGFFVTVELIHSTEKTALE